MRGADSARSAAWDLFSKKNSESTNLSQQEDTSKNYNGPNKQLQHTHTIQITIKFNNCNKSNNQTAAAATTQQ